MQEDKNIDLNEFIEYTYEIWQSGKLNKLNKKFQKYTKEHNVDHMKEVYSQDLSTFFEKYHLIKGEYFVSYQNRYDFPLVLLTNYRIILEDISKNKMYMIFLKDIQKYKCTGLFNFNVDIQLKNGEKTQIVNTKTAINGKYYKFITTLEK